MQTTHSDSESFTAFRRIVMGRNSKECGKFREMLTLRVTFGASASVFALMLTSSMALASGASIDAIAEENYPILYRGYPVFIDGEMLHNALPEQIKTECPDGSCAELVQEHPVLQSDALAGLDPITYQNELGVAPAVKRASSERAVASADDIPNFVILQGRVGIGFVP